MQKNIPADIRKAAAIIIQNKRLLVVKPKRGDIFLSPGGKYEGNESPLECLSRELREELGIEVISEEYYRTYQERAVSTGKKLSLETYFVKYEGAPVPSSEIETLYWASPQEILDGTINAASGLKNLVPNLIVDGHI